jgi:hypothetical protein
LKRTNENLYNLEVLNLSPPIGCFKAGLKLEECEKLLEFGFEKVLSYFGTEREGEALKHFGGKVSDLRPFMRELCILYCSEKGTTREMVQFELVVRAYQRWGGEILVGRYGLLSREFLSPDVDLLLGMFAEPIANSFMDHGQNLLSDQ